jgi:hypothetical protein
VAPPFTARSSCSISGEMTAHKNSEAPGLGLSLAGAASSFWHRRQRDSDQPRKLPEPRADASSKITVGTDTR